MAIRGLYAIVDPARIVDGSDDIERVEEVTRAVLRGGASVVQLRDKESTSRRRYRLACALAVVCAEFGAPFIVNDRLDIALASGADGVHLGPEDVPVKATRSLVDEDFIVGASAGTVEAARRLESEGADYLGVGAIYEARQSKPDASPPRGPEAISKVVDAVDIPVVAIGGIDETNAAEPVEHGASGVAVIRALMGADDPEAAARRLAGGLG